MLEGADVIVVYRETREDRHAKLPWEETKVVGVIWATDRTGVGRRDEIVTVLDRIRYPGATSKQKTPLFILHFIPYSSNLLLRNETGSGIFLDLSDLGTQENLPG